MAKKRKIKKRILILVGIIGFFIVYTATYVYFSKKQASDQPVKVENKDTQEDSRSLLAQMKTTDTVYMSDKNLQDVRVE
ncbi:MAG: hypothetical protein ACLVIU_04340, partial [Paraclostridium sp.]